MIFEQIIKMGKLKYVFLACLVIKISSCYILRAPSRLPSSDLRPFSRPIYRPLRQSVYPRPRIHSLRLPFAFRERLPYRNLENLNFNNINNNNNDDNQMRPIRGSRRVIRISRTQLAPPRIRYPPGVRRLDRSIIRGGRISSFGRRSSTGISRSSRRKVATRSRIRNVPDRSRDKVMALFAVDGPRAKQISTSRRRVIAPTSKIRSRPVIKPKGLSSFPVASEVMSKTTSVQRIIPKITPSSNLKSIEGSIISKSKTVGSQIKEAKITKQKLRATKHGQSEIFESKKVPQNPTIVPAAILSKETNTKVDIKQDLIVADADTVNIKTDVVGKATENVQSVKMKEPVKAQVERSTIDLSKSIKKLTKEVNPIKTAELVQKGTKKETSSNKKLTKEVNPVKTVESVQVSTKKETSLKDSAVIVKDTKGKTAETSMKSSISVKDADTVNIKAATKASSGEVTGGSKTETGKKVVIPDAVVVGEKTIAISDSAVAETATLDKKTVVVDSAKGFASDLKIN